MQEGCRGGASGAGRGAGYPPFRLHLSKHNIRCREVQVHVTKLGSLEKTWRAKKQIISPLGLFRPEHNLFMRRIHARPAQATCELVWGNPCIPCIFMIMLKQCEASTIEGWGRIQILDKFA